MRFSVIIPAYNAENFILRGVSSVLNQTFSDFEIVVVDDGSKDGTLEQLNTVHDERLVVISQINQGVSVARNTGIDNAHGDYICFLDADDEYLPSHLERLSMLIDKNNTRDFFVSRSCIGLLSGKILESATTGDYIYIQNVVEETLNNTEMVWTGCVCIRRYLFDKYGLFEPGVRLGEDTDMWKRLYVHTGIVYDDTITVKRNRDGSEATKFYIRRYEADPLNRLPDFIADETISDNIKESLKTEYEWTKLQVVRSYLIEGDKRKAKNLIREINIKRVPKKRMFITYCCFCVPSGLIKLVLDMKNTGMYK